MQDLDEKLIKNYIGGSEESFKILINRHTPAIYNYSRRFVGEDYANDVTQEVFIKVWRNLNKFDNSKAHFRTWLFAIARNTITDYLRKKKIVLFSSLDTEEETFEQNIEDKVILPDQALIKLEDKEYLNKVLKQLPPNYKEVLILYYQEDMTFKEIGEVLNKPLNTVKSYHHRAIILLRKIMHQK